MSIKDEIQERIERNSVKSYMSWTDKKGEVHAEEVIMKKSNFPIIGDWSRIYPPINEDGKINLMNLIFGGRRNLIKLLGIMLILTLVYFWIMGILGANAEYMNGQKYVIVEKDSFYKYCKAETPIITPSEDGYEGIDVSNFQLSSDKG